MHETELYPTIIKGAAKEDIRLFQLLAAGVVQPFDLIGFRRGSVVGMEVKVDRRPGTIRWGDPMPASWWRNRRHQLVWLHEVARQGGNAWIVFRHLATGGDWLIQWRAHNDVSYMVNYPIQRIISGQLGPGFTGWEKAATGLTLPEDVGTVTTGKGGELTSLGRKGGYTPV